jgi:diaminopimelate decarboxylase
MTKISAKPSSSVNTFGEKQGQLTVGGVPLEQLARRVGQTPFYAYDRSLITNRIEQLRLNLPRAVHVHYAMKANPMPAVVQHIAQLVDGLDVASAKEMLVALDTPMSPGLISFAGPGKTEAELSQAVAAGVVLNLESEAEMRIVGRLGRTYGVRPKVAVRVNPDFELKSSGMRMGGGSQQFGVDAAKVPSMLGKIGRLGLDFQGFHIFAGSQNLRPDSIKESQEKTIALALSLSRHAPGPVHHVNIGGGFGIPYAPGDKPLDIQPIGKAHGGLVKLVAPVLPKTRIVIELGRYIVGESGVYVCRVIDRKVSRGETFLITDGGLHHHLAASGNFGQVIRRNYPVAVGTRMRDKTMETVNVVGPLCTPLDLLGAKVELPRAKVGDLIVVFQSGAYGLTASPINFLSHPAPVEVLL